MRQLYQQPAASVAPCMGHLYTKRCNHEISTCLSQRGLALHKRQTLAKPQYINTLLGGTGKCRHSMQWQVGYNTALQHWNSSIHLYPSWQLCHSQRQVLQGDFIIWLHNLYTKSNWHWGHPWLHRITVHLLWTRSNYVIGACISSSS